MIAVAGGLFLFFAVVTILAAIGESSIGRPAKKRQETRDPFAGFTARDCALLRR